MSQFINKISYNKILTVCGNEISFRIEIWYNILQQYNCYIKQYEFIVKSQTTIFDEKFIRCSKTITSKFSYTELLKMAERTVISWYIREYNDKLINIYYPKFLENLSIKPSKYDLYVGTLWYDEYNLKFSIGFGISTKRNRILGEIRGDITNPLSMIKRLEKLIKQEAIETWKSELKYKIGIEKYEIN